MGFVENIKLKAYSRASRYIYHSTLVEGYLRGSDEPFRCLFVDNSSLINYMTSKGFLERMRVLKKEKDPAALSAGQYRGITQSRRFVCRRN